MGIEATSLDTSAATKSASPTPAPAAAANDDGEMTFWDVLDVINPLQQLPIVGSIYREITGDTIKPASRIMGGVLFGGLTGGLSLLGCVTGGVSALANVVVEKETGKDIAGNAIAATFGESDETRVAQDTPRAAPVGPPIQITPLPPPSGSSTSAPVLAAASSSPGATASTGGASRIKWNAAPVVGDGAGPVRVERHRHQRREAGERFVDRVVDDLVDHVMQARAVIGVADIHAGALAHRVEATQDLDAVGAVFGGSVGLVGIVLPFGVVLFFFVAHSLTATNAPAPTMMTAAVLFMPLRARLLVSNVRTCAAAPA